MADEILIGKRLKDNAKALCVKAEAMYNLGNFEHALMCFHNALRRSNIKVDILTYFSVDSYAIDLKLEWLNI